MKGKDEKGSEEIIVAQKLVRCCGECGEGLCCSKKVVSPEEILLLNAESRPCYGCDGNFCIAEGLGSCMRDE